MWTALAGLPGKITTLLSRLSDARATKLDSLDTTVSSRMPGTTTHRDRIDAAISSRMPGTVTEQARIDTTISSRAPASTALSNATWTDTRAGYIDTTISSRAPSSTALHNAVWTDTRAGYLDAITQLLPIANAPAAGGLTVEEFATSQTGLGSFLDSYIGISSPLPHTSYTTNGTYTPINLTSKRGVLQFLAISLTPTNTSGVTPAGTVTATLAIDGVTVWSDSITTPTQMDYYKGWIVVGHLGSIAQNLDQIIQFDNVPFHSSCVLTITTTGMNYADVDVGWKYRIAR